MYASKSCAAIYDDFRNSPERAAHDLDTYIFTFTKIVMLSLQFSEMRPAFLKAVFQCESFDVGLIRVRESPEVRVMVLSRLIHLFCTHLTHCAKVTKKAVAQNTVPEIIDSGPMCITDLSQNKYLACFDPK